MAPDKWHPNMAHSNGTLAMAPHQVTASPSVLAALGRPSPHPKQHFRLCLTGGSSFHPKCCYRRLSHEARNKAAEQQEFKVPIYRTGNESRFIALVDVSSGNVETNLPTIKSERWHVWESWMFQASTRTKGKNCFSMFFPFPCRKGVTVPGAWFWPNGPAACLCRFRFPPRLPRRRLLSVMAGLKRGCIVKTLAQLRVDDPKIQLVVNVLFFKKTHHLLLILRRSCLQYDLQCLRLKKKHPIHENEPCFLHLKQNDTFFSGALICS